MSVQRAVAPLASIFRTVPIFSRVTPESAQICLRCRTSYLRQSRLPPAKRHLATAVAYRPQTFDTEPLPRNAGIPDTSIAGPQPQKENGRISSPSSVTIPQPQYPPNSSITEAEAQIPRRTEQSAAAASSLPVAAPSSTTSAEPRPRRSKLRPRKAAMTLSSAAVAQLQGLLKQPDPKYIRVGVKNRGCSGLAYHLEYVDKPGMFDEAVDQDGVKVLIDSKALFSIIGSEMDWVEDKLSRRFVFKNPNITEQCGCGESFSIS